MLLNPLYAHRDSAHFNTFSLHCDSTYPLWSHSYRVHRNISRWVLRHAVSFDLVNRWIITFQICVTNNWMALKSIRFKIASNSSWWSTVYSNKIRRNDIKFIEMSLQNVSTLQINRIWLSNNGIDTFFVGLRSDLRPRFWQNNRYSFWSLLEYMGIIGILEIWWHGITELVIRRVLVFWWEISIQIWWVGIHEIGSMTAIHHYTACHGVTHRRVHWGLGTKWNHTIWTTDWFRNWKGVWKWLCSIVMPCDGARAHYDFEGILWCQPGTGIMVIHQLDLNIFLEFSTIENW